MSKGSENPAVVRRILISESDVAAYEALWDLKVDASHMVHFVRQVQGAEAWYLAHALECVVTFERSVSEVE